ncbi:MAG: hypothetical protein ACI4SF_14125 [Oscillospiraceae bacterium]
MNEKNSFAIEDFINSYNMITEFKGSEDSLKGKYELVARDGGPIFSQIPSLIGAAELSQAYHIRIPDGFTINDLTRLTANGELTTVIRKNGKIAAHASLFSASASSIALGVFSVLSIVTSQYFLKIINDKLEQIKNQLSDVKNILNIMHYSELHANIELIQEIHRDRDAIILNSNYVQAVIAKILDIKSNAMSFIRFYSEMLYDKTKSLSKFGNKKDPESECKISEIITYKECYQLSVSLYIAACIMQVVYTENLHNTEYIDRFVSDFERIKKSYADNISKFNQDCLVYIGAQKAKNNDKEVFNIITENNDTVFYDDLIEKINRIKSFSQNPEEYIVFGEKVYAKLPS